ncbi:MAG: PRC-barrel domain-containing protein [Hyphomicrobiaceae bacterium]
MFRRTRTVALILLLGVSPGQVLATSSPKPAGESTSSETRQLSPEEKMQRRYPQPARVGDLIGLPLLDDDDRTLGHIKHVVKTQAGKLQLIVTYGGFLGLGQRLVAVPIEVVAIAGRQLASLDMTRAEFDAAPTWIEGQATPVAANEIIRVALYKR